ncbi:MAG: hypothetical protein HRU09_20470 [Oligoflexales bacterium]|nr:hypothetical protein [Oligoflexales bacterium]
MAEKNIFGKERKEDENKDKKGKKTRKIDDRGASNDWEALAMVINDHPDLKARVLHKIKAMKNEKNNEGTKRQSRQEILEQRRKEQGGK